MRRDGGCGTPAAGYEEGASDEQTTCQGMSQGVPGASREAGIDERTPAARVRRGVRDLGGFGAALSQAGTARQVSTKTQALQAAAPRSQAARAWHDRLPPSPQSPLAAGQAQDAATRTATLIQPQTELLRFVLRICRGLRRTPAITSKVTSSCPEEIPCNRP